MKKLSVKKLSLLICISILIVLVSLAISTICIGKNMSVSAQNYSLTPNGSYLLADNTGYYPSKAEAYSMPFGSRTIGKIVINNVEYRGYYKGIPAYSIDNNYPVSIKYTLNYSKDKINNSVWSLSADTATSVNGISLGDSSIGKGCIIIEKKNLNEKKYTVQAKIGNIFNYKNSFEKESFNGNDISIGCYYRVTLSYEIFRTYKVKKGWWIFSRDVTETEFKNCMEVYNFFIGRNSCNVQILDLADKDYSAYSTDESEINIIKNGDTLKGNSVTSKGFQINFLNNKSYKVSISRNGGNYTQVYDGYQEKRNGKYNIFVESLFGKKLYTTVYVYNGGEDKGYATYFGSSIFSGKRIADLSQSLQTYQTGVKIHLNGVGKNIPLIRGEIINKNTNVVTKINASSVAQDITLNNEGIYYLKLTNADTNLSGTYYQYDFAFIVSNESSKPSVNKNNVLNTYSISDYDTKHIEVIYKMPTGKNAYICFDEDDYYSAYQFAYAVEKKYVTKSGDNYIYNGKTYSDNTILVEAMNNSINNKIKYEYFTKALDNYYLDTENLNSSIKIEELNYSKDIYVSTSVNIGKILKKENIVNGNFKFVKIGDYETNSITATNVKNNNVINLKYNTNLSSMIKESGKYLITEKNIYNEIVQYYIVYCGTNETEVNLTVHDKEVNINKENYQFIKGNKIIIKEINNSLDSDGVVVVSNLTSKEVNLYNYKEIINKEFSNDDYLFTMLDRSGNTYSFVLICNSQNYNNLTEAINLVKNNNQKLFNYIISKGIVKTNKTYIGY